MPFSIHVPSGNSLFPRQQIIESIPEIRVPLLFGFGFLRFLHFLKQVGFGAGSSFDEVFAEGACGQFEEKVFPDLLGEIEASLALFDIKVGGPLCVVGEKFHIFQAGGALQLKGRFQGPSENDQVIETIDTDVVFHRSDGTDGIVLFEVEKGGRELSGPEKSFFGDFVEKNFHFQKVTI
jgi:hypothetical protein